MTPVPPGCVLAGSPIDWSGIATKPVLTYAGVQPPEPVPGGSQTRRESTTVLRRVVTPAVGGVAAPQSWLAILARSLRDKTGRAVHTDAGEGKSDGQLATSEMDGERPPALVFYSGVEQVSASFTVGCDPPVSGTFVSWTTDFLGVVACDSTAYRSGPRDELAFAYCPEVITPQPS